MTSIVSMYVAKLKNLLYLDEAPVGEGGELVHGDGPCLGGKLQ